jgi:hypothetical protein
LIDALLLEGVEKAVRRFVPMRVDDPVIRVMLAAILANFVPDRDCSLWLVFVGNSISSRADLPRLLSGWPRALKLASRKNLAKLTVAGDPQMIWARDLMQLQPTDTKQAPGFRQRLTAIYDQAHVGMITSAGSQFYRWKARHEELEGRFLAYWTEPLFEGFDPAGRRRVDEQRTESAHWLPHAAGALQRFLELAIADIHSYDAIKLTEQQRKRLAAAVTFVQAALAAVPEAIGRDLFHHTQTVARLMAFIAGSVSVTETDMHVAIQLVLSQVPVNLRHVTQYALAREGSWLRRDCYVATGLTRRIGERILEALDDLGWIDSQSVAGDGPRLHGMKYKASDRARALSRAVWGNDGEGVSHG